MVDRYAKFATENLQAAASRIESVRDKHVIDLSRFGTAGTARDPLQLGNCLNDLAPRPGLEPGTCGLTVRRSTN